MYEPPVGDYRLPPPSRYDKGLRMQLSYTGFVLFAMLLVQSIVQLLPLFSMARLFLGGSASYLLVRFASIFIYFLATLSAILLGVLLFGRNSRLLFPLPPVRRDYLWPALWAGLGVAMVGNLAAMTATAALGSVGVYSVQNTPDLSGGWLTVLLTLLGSTLLPAVLEELLFRGVLLQPLRRYGDRLAVVVSTLLFALCHPTLPQFVNALVVGAVLGVFAVRTGSLRLPMLLHLVYNSFACLVTLAVYRLPPTAGVVTSWLAMLVLLVAGLVGGLVLRRRFGPVWWVPQQGPPAAVVWRSTLGSVPLWAVGLLCITTILRNLYFG